MPTITGGGGSKTDDRGRMFESFVTGNNDMSSSNQSWQATQRAVSSIAVVRHQSCIKDIIKIN